MYTQHENQESSCNLYITSDGTYVLPSDLGYFKILLPCVHHVVTANHSTLYLKTRLQAQVYSLPPTSPQGQAFVSLPPPPP
jgi:hypothetical protein